MTYERKDIKFTMSVGVTNLSKADIEISEALGRADKALYEAKHRGRNQVKSLQV
jgi:PleD family two-component response regulator